MLSTPAAAIAQQAQPAVESQSTNGDIGPLSPESVRAALADKLSKSGGSVTGALSLDQTLTLSAAASPHQAFAATANPSAIVLGAGNAVSFCPELSCIRSPTTDHQRTSALISAVTRDDAHSEEQTLAVVTTIDKGALKKWTRRGRFSAGDNIAFGGARNTVYRQSAADCMSASSGDGPTGKTSGIMDGSCRWEWINDAAIAAKVGAYVETNVKPGSGAAWGAAFNYHLSPGAVPSFNPGVEFDYSNESGTDCALGVADCTGLRVAMGGPNKATTNLAVVSDNTKDYAALWGIRVNGDLLASEAAIEVDSSSKTGLAFGVSRIGGQAHSVATIQDVTTSPTSFSIGGTHSLASIFDSSKSQNGLALNGSYAGAQIVGHNFVIYPNGNVKAPMFQGKLTTPASSSAPCEPGQFMDDADYHYVCVGANTWKRVALSAF